MKEVGVDDEGLAEFQSGFFPHPLYRDEQYVIFMIFGFVAHGHRSRIFNNVFSIALLFRVSFYSALGSRKLSLSTWNPFKLWRGMREVYKRLKVKKISGNLKGEGLIQGGIIIFDKLGKARYAYREETGSEIPIDDIIRAVKLVRGDS